MSELSVFAAIGLGILHSLEPGHGKGVMSAYILASRARAFQAILLGLVSAFSHALSIFLLAGIASFSVQQLTPEQWIHWLELFSGFLILTIGLSRLVKSLRTQIVTVKKWQGKTATKGPSPFHHHHNHGHYHHNHHDHDHDHHHFHYHPKTEPKNLKQFFLVGFLTGIIPCPSALAIILAAVGGHHLAIGVKLVIAFSLGGALTMASLGYILSRTSDKMKSGEGKGLGKFISVGSSLLIILLGGGVLLRAVFHIWS